MDDNENKSIIKITDDTGSTTLAVVGTPVQFLSILDENEFKLAIEDHIKQLGFDLTSVKYTVEGFFKHMQDTVVKPAEKALKELPVEVETKVKDTVVDVVTPVLAKFTQSKVAEPVVATPAAEPDKTPNNNV